MPASEAGLLQELAARIHQDPFNVVATVIFALAVLHTFVAARFMELSHRLQARSDREADAAGRPRLPSVGAELLHFFGEVEVVFGLWTVPLLVLLAIVKGIPEATHYINDTLDFTEAIFVVIIMSLASTRPVFELAERLLASVSRLLGGTTAAWWTATLVVAPLLGSFITEPAAMTIGALLLGRHFFARGPSRALKYATLGLLFVNVSIGGTLTHFAAPPVLMAATPWGWDLTFMLSHFGWRAALAIVVSTVLFRVWFRRELRDLGTQTTLDDLTAGAEEQVAAATTVPIPLWVTLTYVAFVVWTVINAHYPVLLVGGFLFFLGLDRATVAYSKVDDIRTPLLVGFFLAGLVIHGSWQAWWIAPVLSRLSEVPLFAGAVMLTAFNDNALITYLATLVPNLSEPLKIAVVEGAVIGGGLTVIANAPNPAGYALLSPYFDGAIHPLRLFLGALVPTLIAVLVFRLT
jgi:hypothetical protein